MKNRGRGGLTKLRLLAGAHLLGFAVIIAAGLALAVALGAQYFGGLSPCALCLIARWPYRIALIAGAAALILPPRFAMAALWVALACFAADFAVASLHVGVEFGWWKSPLSECTAPSLAGLTGADLLRAMPLRPVTPCDAPVYLVPGFNLSMAAMNLVYAAGCCLALTWALIRPGVVSWRRHS